MSRLPSKRGLAAAALPLAAGLVIFFEGNRQEAYLDPVGIPTVCAGHTEGVQLGQVYTQAECDRMLRKDVEGAMASVLALTAVPLSPHELTAYTSFVYNAGHGAFARSTLLRKLNAGDREGACGELLRWVYAKGKKLPGLVKRRQAEHTVCRGALA